MISIKYHNQKESLGTLGTHLTNVRENDSAITYALANKVLYKYPALDLMGTVNLSIKNKNHLKTLME